MSEELFEDKPKKRGRKAGSKTKLSKNEQNKKTLSKMVEKKNELKESDSTVGGSAFTVYHFKCAECGVSVTLQGDHPSFPKRTKCHRCENE